MGASAALNTVSPMTGVAPVNAGDSFMFDVMSKVRPDAIQMLRRHCMDLPQYNDLLENTNELEDFDYAVALIGASEFANSVPPPSRNASAAFRFGLPIHMMLGLGMVMAMAPMVNRRMRNELPGSDTGTAINITKANEYRAWMAAERDFWRKQLIDYKVMLNVSRPGTLLPSAYFYNFLV